MNKTCQHCGVYEDEHDYEHMARECYPTQIDKLYDEIGELTAERDRYKAENERLRKALEGIVQHVETRHDNSDYEELRAAIERLGDEIAQIAMAALKEGGNVEKG